MEISDLIRPSLAFHKLSSSSSSSSHSYRAFSLSLSMVDSIESSVFQSLIGLLASPIAQKIGDVFDLGEELQALARARARAQDDVVDGSRGIQRRLVAYEDEDLLHNLMIVAASFMDSGEEEEGSGRYELEFDGNS